MEHVAIIGSSPIMMLEAIHLANIGKKVTIIEKNPELGGAWKTFSHKQYNNIELGCHIWEYNQSSYNFIEKKIGVELEKLVPEPLFIKNNIKLHYNRKEVPVILLRSLKHLKELNFYTLFSEGVYFLRNKLFFRKVDYYYAKNGCNELTSKLIDKIKTSKDIKIEQLDVKKIISNDESVELISEKKSIHCDKLLLPSNFEADITIKNEPLKLKVGFDKEIYHCFIICNKSEILSDFSYLRFIKHPIFHRASNASFEEFKKLFPEKVLLVVGVLAKAAKQENINQLILQELKKNNLYDGTPEEMFWKEYKSKEYENSELRKVQKKSNGKISYVDTSCLSNGIFKQLKRWGDLKI
jgi:hypothetical protein